MRRIVCWAVAFLLAAAPAAAQNDPRLVAAVRAAQDGQGDSARSAVDRLLAATAPTDSLYPEILYTHAMVSNTAADMRTHFQRVVVEYPTSTWADDALVRVVQLDYATRSYENAARNLERLRLDHPMTPLFAQAAYWGGRTYLDLKDTARACRWLADGIARADTDLELQRQLGFLYQRCEGRTASADSGAAARPAGAAGDTTSKPSAARDSTVPPKAAAADSAAERVADSLPRRAPPAAVQFRVQVAAVATPAAADDAATKAERLGYPAMIVRERGFYKVRAGGFATRQQAQAAAAKLKSGMGGSPFVVVGP